MNNVMIGAVKARKFIADSKKHEKNFTKAVYYGMEYNKLVDLKNQAEGAELYNAANKFDKQAEAAFNKHLEYMDLLPKKEKSKVEKTVFRFK